MSYARLRSELLAVRDAREALFGSILTPATTTVIFVSTAMPGPRKSPAGSDALFHWGITRLVDRSDGCRLIHTASDRLGPYAILTATAEPHAVKRECVSIENEQPAARLLDLDVYGLDTKRIGRVEVGELPRPCLLCTEPAVDCIRLKRHPMEALLERVHHLLEAFDVTAAC
jgi:holo-ACP synthase CitX